MEGMDALQISLTASDKALRQFTTALNGLSEAESAAKLGEHSLSPNEMTLHLAECRAAVMAQIAGQEHEWGTFQPAEGEAPTAALERMQGEAKAAAAAAADPAKAAEVVMDYMALHDAYHVGQLVTYRLTCQPEWDHYSIYR
jgi:uncharacterized damage-inducible protein DinB